MVKKQICFVITKSNFGGAQKYVYELATSLDKETFEITVALGGEGLLKQKLLDSGVEVLVVPGLENSMSLFKSIKPFSFLYNLFNERHFDVVHLNSSKVGVIGAVSAKLSGIPKIIFTAHGWAFNENRSKISKIVIKFYHWLTIILSDKTIAVSENIKSQVIGWPFVSNKISVIHNGVKEIDFYEKSEARKKLSEKNSKIDSNKFIIGTIAELHPIKGLDILIESAKEIVKNKNVQFVIIGEGNERKNLEEKIKLNNLENNVILLGFLDGAAKYLKAFDLFVLPSRSEALALVILEASLANIPIICSKVGGLPEIISDKKYGALFEKENHKQLSEEINYVIENYEEAKNKSENLKEKIKNNFSYQKMLSSTNSLY